MIKLSQEIPTSKVREWSALSDLDFVIATAVLRDAEYAKALKRRPIGRELILDNAYHEEGVPLSVEDLFEAAVLCDADYVIAPDKVNDIDFTTTQYYEARFRMGRHFKLAVVMMDSTAGNASEREAFLRNVGTADMLCCSFKTADRFAHYTQSVMAQRWTRVHLLGLAELAELEPWVEMVKRTGRRVSLDTGKCLKHALNGKRLDQLKSLRISPTTTSKGEVSEASKRILNLTAGDIPADAERLFLENIRILRRHLGQEVDGAGSEAHTPRHEGRSGGQQLQGDAGASGKNVSLAPNPAKEQLDNVPGAD